MEIDLYTGLPYFFKFSQSPFLCVADFARHVRRFRGVRSRLSHVYSESGQEIVICRDHQECLECSGTSVPVVPPLFTKKEHTLKMMAGLITEAIWSGYPLLPSDADRVQNLCKVLKRADYYLITPVLLRMLVQRDCVDAYEAIIEVFGGTDYPGTNEYRLRYFQILQKHLAVWSGLNIKRYLRDQVDDRPGAKYPTKTTLLCNKILLGDPFGDISMRLSRFAEVHASLEKSEIIIFHCPFQAFPTKRFSCNELSALRFYGFTQEPDVNRLFARHPCAGSIQPAQ
jgi:hypothetical protein